MSAEKFPKQLESELFFTEDDVFTWFAMNLLPWSVVLKATMKLNISPTLWTMSECEQKVKQLTASLLAQQH